MFLVDDDSDLIIGVTIGSVIVIGIVVFVVVIILVRLRIKKKFVMKQDSASELPTIVRSF